MYPRQILSYVNGPLLDAHKDMGPGCMFIDCASQRTCSALAVPCSAILQCTARPLKCICCKHTVASHCRCSVHYTAMRSVYEVWNSAICFNVGIGHFKGSAWGVCNKISIIYFIWSAIHVHCRWNIMYFKRECNALESEVQCTLREGYHWSAQKCALRYTGNALHFDLG